MSLINQMLQELDARGTSESLGGVLQGQVRVVPQSRRVHPAWWLALLLVVALCAGGLWVLLGRAAPAVADHNVALPLVLDMELQLPPIVAAPAAKAITQPENHALAGRDPAVPANVPARPAVIPAPAERPSVAAPAVAPPVAATDAAPALPATSSAPLLAKQIRELTPQQLAENEYRKASNLIQQGRTAEAIAALEQALRLDPRHVAARQTLTATLIEARRPDDAMHTLREGLQLDASQAGLAMILARLQLERGDLKPALETLQRSLPYAADRADYLAFLAALLQRDGRHREAIEQYAQALRKSPNNGVWWMGQGISLQADGRIPEAIEAYSRAKAGNGLSAELRAFVEEKLNRL